MQTMSKTQSSEAVRGRVSTRCESTPDFAETFSIKGLRRVRVAAHEGNDISTVHFDSDQLARSLSPFNLPARLFRRAGCRVGRRMDNPAFEMDPGASFYLCLYSL